MRRRIVGGVYKRTRVDEEGKRAQRAEIRFDDVAGCLRTPVGGSSRQSIMIVEGEKVRSRLLAPREAARLMGLPESYKLPEKYNEAYHLVGDGVVVPVVRFLAANILESLLARETQMREGSGVRDDGSQQHELAEFVATHSFRGKGPLSVALVVTQHARKLGLPLDPEKLLTEGGGQVLGLGKGAVQAILKRHGIARVLASEGGRTSRGSLNNMREYVAFLNALKGKADLDSIEGFWIERVNEFFAGKPFKIKLDASRSLRTVVRDVIAQAVERQKERAWHVLRWRRASTSGRREAGLRPRQREIRTQQLFDGRRAQRTRRGFFHRRRRDSCHDIAR
jgi:hypothetical protein